MLLMLISYMYVDECYWRHACWQCWSWCFFIWMQVMVILMLIDVSKLCLWAISSKNKCHYIYHVRWLLQKAAFWYVYKLWMHYDVLETSRKFNFNCILIVKVANGVPQHFFYEPKYSNILSMLKIKQFSKVDIKQIKIIVQPLFC